LQSKIDAALSDPAIAFNGDAKADVAAARAAQKAIATAEDLLDQSDASTGNATDLLHTRVEEAALRDKAIAALGAAATSHDDRALLALMRGDAARDRETFADALAAYREAASLAPNDTAAFEGIAFSAHRLHQYADAVDADTKLVALQPGLVDPYVDLGIEQGKAGRYPDAYRSFASAVELADKARAAKPNDAVALRKLAWAHLYFGRTYASAGDASHARSEFAQTLALATKLPPHDSRHDMYLEEAQEATVALDLGTPGATTVSLAPWTGSELPGSVPNTFKYRLVVAGTGGKNVALRAADVPKGWVASFCTDRICAPFRVSVDIPSSGVKVIEFQLVPPGSHDKPRAVRVIESDGSHTASATTT
jgi:tetratricopeptide (TPR) repeat protein